MSSSSPRRYDASGRRESARQRRIAVVEAARRLFLEEGYGSTSIAGIAEEAGVSPQTVYAAFGSKAGILDAVVGVAVAGDHEEGLARERPDAVALMAVPDARAWIRAGAAFTRTVHERSAALIRIVTSVAGSDPAVAELEATMRANRRSDLVLYVQGGPLREVRPDLSDEQKADLLYVLTDTEAWWHLVEVQGWSPDAYEAWLDDTVCRLFLPAGP